MKSKVKCFDKITAELWRNGELIRDEVLEQSKPIKLIAVNKNESLYEIISIDLIKN